MQFQFKITIGTTEITVVENAESQAEFVEKVSFFSGLPTTGPNGETDLKLVHRRTKEGYNYYSIVSEKAGKEFNLGQSQKEPGKLFGKGWEDLYVGEQGDTNVVGGIGTQQAQPVPQTQQAAPQQFQQQQFQQPVQQVQQPVPQPIQQAPQPAQAAPQQVQQPVQAAPAPVTNGANQQVANDVLAKFGI